MIVKEEKIMFRKVAQPFRNGCRRVLKPLRKGCARCRQGVAPTQNLTTVCKLMRLQCDRNTKRYDRMQIKQS